MRNDQLKNSEHICSSINMFIQSEEHYQDMLEEAVNALHSMQDDIKASI